MALISSVRPSSTSTSLLLFCLASSLNILILAPQILDRGEPYGGTTFLSSLKEEYNARTYAGMYMCDQFSLIL